jgi:SAM-dependent methyltransferase
VIGPGLDFTDKRSGYDFYPIQTLQPFALVDSLRRLRLTEAFGPTVEIVDLSARVRDHVRDALAQARKGSAYTVQVPLDQDTRWLPETTGYWRRFGSEIGTSAQALSPPPGVEVRTRAVRIGPDVVKLLRGADLNVVLQHLPLAEDRKLDLMIATNVMVYYEPFEQALALQNIAGMLRPGGMLLSNNALPEVKGVPMRPVGGTSVAYSEDPDDGDHVLWYKRA